MNKAIRPDLRRLAPLLLVAAAILYASGQAAAAGTLYVDNQAPCPGAGGVGFPFCSIANAMRTAVPGDDIRIRRSPRPYDETAAAAHSGTQGRRITIEADDPRQPPLLRDSGNGAMRGMLNLLGVDYWTVRDLVFDGTGVFTSLWAIRVQPRASQMRNQIGIRILDNTFRNWGGSEAEEDKSRGKPAAVDISGGWRPRPGSPLPDGTLIAGNLFDGNRLGNIELLSTKNSIVEGNDFRNTRCGRDTDGAVNEKGIHLVAGTVGVASGDVIRNNSFHDFAAWSACGLESASGAWPLLVGVWCDVDPGSGVVTHNRFWNLGYGGGGGNAPAIAIHIEEDCHGWSVDHNLIHNIGWSGIRDNPRTAGAVNRLFNNTIDNTGAHGIELAWGGAVVENNIVSNAQTAQIMTYVEAVAQDHMAIDGNLYWSDRDRDAVGQWNSRGGRTGRVLDLTQWQRACGCDRHSLNSNPKFVDPAAGKFRLSTWSPAAGGAERACAGAFC